MHIWQRCKEAARYTSLAVVLLEFLLWQPKLTIALFWAPHLNPWHTVAFKGLLLISLVLALNSRVPMTLLEVALMRVQPCLKRRRQPSARAAQKQEIENRRHYYQLIGACYLHGMMNGEAIRMQNEHEIKAERFEIR
jgi:hypothetical protein